MLFSRSANRFSNIIKPTTFSNFGAVRALSSKSEDDKQSKLVEQLMKDNPSLIEAVMKTNDALNLAGAKSPSIAEMKNLSDQYVNVKAALSYVESSVSKVMRFGNQTGLKQEPVRVAVTGAAGAIGYSLIFRIASGNMLGPHQPVILHLIEVEPAMKALEGVVMELKDCAFPLVAGIQTFSSPEKGFEGIDYALLVGAKPRGKGMERGDLLNENGKIFVPQGQALNKFANRNVKVVVVGNPANTNCLIAASNAPNLRRDQFSALTRLDHDRALAQVAIKLKCHPSQISQLCIWGNHSSTQYPDLTNSTHNGKSVKSLINDDNWIKTVFIPTVQKRGAAIIEARGASSAASAANAAIAHMRDWVYGTGGQWQSMAVPSTSAYGIGEGVYFSYPLICENGGYKVVEGLNIDAFSQEMITATKKELFQERDLVKAMLPN